MAIWNISTAEATMVIKLFKKMPKITTCLNIIPTSRTRPAQLTIAAFLRRLFVQTELNRNFYSGRLIFSWYLLYILLR